MAICVALAGESVVGSTFDSISTAPALPVTSTGVEGPGMLLVARSNGMDSS